MPPVTVLYFGDLMSQLAIGREQMRLPPNVNNVESLRHLLSQRGGEWKRAFAHPRATLRIMVNKSEATADTPVGGGDEIAFIESLSL